MLMLFRTTRQGPARGYATTFLRQLEPVLGTVADRGTKVVVNAGGLAPAACAEAVRDAAARARPRPAGRPRRGRRPAAAGRATCDLLDHLDTGAPLGDRGAADRQRLPRRLGHRGGARRRRAGRRHRPRHRRLARRRRLRRRTSAGRATTGTRLAGAVAVGHVLECGTQATGGNYAFVREEVARPGAPRLPASPRSRDDGSAVITKHEGTGGRGHGRHRHGAAAVRDRRSAVRRARTSSPTSTRCALAQDGPDRVRLSGARGRPAGGRGSRSPQHARRLPQPDGVRADRPGRRGQGRSSRSTGCATPTRTRSSTSWCALDRAGRRRPTSRPPRCCGCTVRGDDPKVLGRAFSGAAVELALASYPGFTLTSPPGDATPYGVYWPALVDADEVEHVVVHADGRREVVPPRAPGARLVRRRRR